MPFQIRDETAGANIVYVDNLNQMGLGGLPNANQQMTIRGGNFVSVFGTFACGILPPGAQAGFEGSVFAPGGSTATVAVSTAQIPTVTASLRSTTVDNTHVIFDNSAGSNTTVNYAIW